MTIISHRHRFVFIAVPKTGSHTIRFAVRDQLGPDDVEQVALFAQRAIPYPPFSLVQHGHQLAREVRDALGERWTQYLTFAVVRNPWDRFVSHCAFFLRHTNQFQIDPKGCMRRILDNPQHQSPIHFRPQADFVTDVDGAIVVGKLCRAEQLQADFDDVCARTGLAPRVLERRNPSNHQHYTAYFDDELIRRVGEQYRRDVELFGYAFG